MKTYFLILITCLLFAQPADAADPWFAEHRDSEKAYQFSFQGYEESYLLPGVVSNYVPAGRKSIETQFQFSLQMNIYEGEWINANFSYTQRSFWQTQMRSLPFRENNYQPAFFLVSPWDLNLFDIKLGLEFGLQHLSNGLAGLDSRSWNRAFMTLKHESEDKKIKYKHHFWYRVPDPFDVDLNADILNFYGHQEGYIRFQLSENTRLSIRERWNFSQQKGMAEVMLMAPLGKANLQGMLYYFKGYGDSLIDYNQSLTKIGLGVIFIP